MTFGAAGIPHPVVGFAFPEFDPNTHLRHSFVYTSFQIHPVIVRQNMSREFDEDAHADHKKAVQGITYRHTSATSTVPCIRHGSFSIVANWKRRPQNIHERLVCSVMFEEMGFACNENVRAWPCRINSDLQKFTQPTNQQSVVTATSDHALACFEVLHGVFHSRVADKTGIESAVSVTFSASE